MLKLCKKNNDLVRIHSSCRYVPVALVVCIGAAASILAFIAVRNLEQKRVQSGFMRAAEDRVSILRERISDNLSALDWIAGFCAGSTEVEQGDFRTARDEFRTLVKSYLLRKPGIQALEWIPRVRDAERAAYETAAREDQKY